MKKGCIVWIPVAHYKAFKGELSGPHEVLAISDKRIINGVTEYLVEWKPSTRVKKAKGVETLEVEEFEDSWQPEERLNCRRSIQEFEDNQTSSIGTSK